MRPDNYSNPYDWGAYGVDSPPLAVVPPMAVNGVKGLVSGWMSDDLKEGVSSLVVNSVLAAVPLYIGTADVEAIPSYQSKAMITVGSAVLGSMVLLKGIKVLKI